jgi:arginase
VPYHAGDQRPASSAGPKRLIDAGAVDVLHGHGHSVIVRGIDRIGPFRDTASSSAAVNKRLAEVVARAHSAGRMPLIVTGSCDSCLGVLAGFDHRGWGAIWIDAHADFNTPESTASGFFPGMSLAIATGHCYRAYWSQIGDNAPMAEKAIAMFGVRDLSPEVERERLQSSAISVVGWHEGKPDSAIDAALDRVAEHATDVYLHIDFDGFAPNIAPGVVDEPVEGGLALADARLIVQRTFGRFRVRAITLATYTPANDKADATLRLALELVDLIGECIE